MSFTAAHVGPWAVGEKLTSAQMNQLDADHVNSLDKTGDTINGGLIQVDFGGEIRSITEGGITTTVASGIKVQSADGLLIDSTNGLTIGGASSNYPKFLTTRTRVTHAPFIPDYVGVGWTCSPSGVAAIYFLGPGTSASAYMDITPWMHDGATLTEIALAFAVTLAHPSIPAVLPKINIARTTLTVGQTAPNGVSLNSGGQQTLPAPGTAAAYVNGNLSQFLVFPCDQNNVIDKTQYKYTAIITDENGANSVANSTAAMGLRVTHGSIANMRFQ